MITELRDKLTVDLDPNPSFERGLGGQSRSKQARDFMVVGSSNASKLASALAAQGYTSCVVFTNSWRISRQNVENLVPKVKEAIHEMDPAVIVFYCIDNSTYYGRTADGSRTAPRQDSTGVYHVAGDVVVASRDVMHEHLTAMKPLLYLVGKRKGIVVAPLPRYVAAGCCSDPDHCSNRRVLDFEQQQQQLLDLLKRGLKDFLFANNYRAIRVLDPCVDIRGMSREAVWNGDPVHPTEEVYRKIAAATAKLGDKRRAAELENKRRRDSQGEHGLTYPDARRGRRDHAPEDTDRQQRGGRQHGYRGGQGSFRSRGGRGRDYY
jgi:hypothetical protein